MGVAAFPWRLECAIDCPAEGGLDAIVRRALAVASAVGCMGEVLSPELMASTFSANALPTTVLDRQLVTTRVARQTPFPALDLCQGLSLAHGSGPSKRRSA